MRDTLVLEPHFLDKYEELVANCNLRGVIIVPYFTRRTPMEQGKLWCQSRDKATIYAKVNELTTKGAQFLAKCISDNAAYAQSGPWATNAIPGYSWHEHDLAVDSYWQREGKKIEWSDTVKDDHGNNGYHVMAEEAVKLGLTAGLNWEHPDSDHVQGPSSSSPGDKYSLQEIDTMMQEKFGNLS